MPMMLTPISLPLSIWYHYQCANFDPKEYEGRDFVCRYCCPETRDSG